MIFLDVKINELSSAELSIISKKSRRRKKENPSMGGTYI